MKFISKILKYTLTAILMLMLAFGMAMPFNFNNREKYMDNQIKIEQVDEHQEEDDFELKELG